MSFRIWGLLLELRSMNTWVHPSRGLVDSWQCAIILVFENSARFGTSGLVFVIVLSVVDNCWRILFLAKDLSMIKQSTNTENWRPWRTWSFCFVATPKTFVAKSTQSPQVLPGLAIILKILWRKLRVWVKFFLRVWPTIKVTHWQRILSD